MKQVSIIIPCFNQGQYLEECIESVLNQTYPNIEVVIVNDGSTDSYTLEILEKMKSLYPQFKIIDIENSGVSHARNVGVENSRGEFILPLDGDDKISTTYIQKCVEVFKEKKDIDIVYCIAELFGERRGVFSLADYSEKEMLRSNVVFCTAMFKRKDYYSCNGYNENMIDGLEDWDFWLSMIENNKQFYRIDEVHFYYRIKQHSRNEDMFNGIDKHLKMIVQIQKNHEDLYRRYNIDIVDAYKRKRNILIKVFYKLKNSIQKIKLNYLVFKNNFTK